MSNIKILDDRSESINFEVTLNKICKTQKFKDYITERHGICPADLTVSCWKENNKLMFTPEIKHYGYESFSNNGTAYTDLSDYVLGKQVEPEMSHTVFDYFKYNEPTLYECMKNTFIF